MLNQLSLGGHLRRVASELPDCGYRGELCRLACVADQADLVCIVAKRMAGKAVKRSGAPGKATLDRDELRGVVQALDAERERYGVGG